MWWLGVLALMAGLLLGWALMGFLVTRGARAELMPERLPLAASRRLSAGSLHSVVMPAAFLAMQDGAGFGHGGPG